MFFVLRQTLVGNITKSNVYLARIHVFKQCGTPDDLLATLPQVFLPRICDAARVLSKTTPRTYLLVLRTPAGRLQDRNLVTRTTIKR